MKKKTLLDRLSLTIASTAIAFGTFTALPATASSLNSFRMFVFGDSNSDVNKSPITRRPYYEPGRFSNGRNWVEYLADDLGINNTNVRNFAVGGSTTGSQNIAPGGTGLKQQIDDYLSLLNGQPANPDALYTLWTGANDYLGGFSSNPLEPVNNVLNAVDTLVQSGARNILIPNLPDLSLTPRARKLDPAISLTWKILGKMHNRFLSRGLRRLSRLNPEVNFISMDINKLFKNVIADPEMFGLTNVTDACTNTDVYDPNSYPWNPNASFSGCNNEAEYLFWDSVHLTTQVHRALAKSALDLLTSELEENNYSTLSTAKIAVASASNNVAVPEPTSVLGLLLIGVFSAVSAAKTGNKA